VVLEDKNIGEEIFLNSFWLPNII